MRLTRRHTVWLYGIVGFLLLGLAIVVFRLPLGLYLGWLDPNWISAIATMIGVVGIFYAREQLVLQRQELERQNLQYRQQQTFQAMFALEHEYADQRRLITRNLIFPGGVKTFDASWVQSRFEALADEPGSENAVAVIQLLNYLELLCIALNSDMIDPKMFEDWIKVPMEQYWTLCKPFVLRMREKKGDPGLFSSLEQVATRFARTL
jgi:hypothetical protein